MSISLDKFVLLHNNIPATELLNLTRVIPYKLLPITMGFKYLGFFIKPLGYRSKDWLWLVQKLKRKLVCGHTSYYLWEADWSLSNQFYPASLFIGWDSPHYRSLFCTSSGVLPLLSCGDHQGILVNITLHSRLIYLGQRNLKDGELKIFIGSALLSDLGIFGKSSLVTVFGIKFLSLNIWSRPL